MIAGAQHRQVGERGGPHSAGDEDGGLGLFQEGVLPGELYLVGIVAVAAVEHLVVGADRVDEGAALVDRGRHRAPVGPAVGGAMDRDG